MYETRAGVAGRRLSTLVSGVVSDAHTWNLVFLQLYLEELGHTVANLGPCVPPELLADECVRRRPDLVVLSSVNGHGFQDGARMIRELRSRPELAALPVVIGGKLGTAGVADRERSAALMDAGFTAVFEDAQGARELQAFVGALPGRSGR
ncbi:cobalamin B12-binding domain-containing protein [Kitasatospora sp. NPDC101157]|uniref:cobalamin B12-binding domain-containing protein n=1 Tax=Kitasatospora sp. NPDC101157 TaxID=3364098 RepID=UPI00382DDE23